MHSSLIEKLKWLLCHPELTFRQQGVELLHMLLPLLPHITLTRVLFPVGVDLRAMDVWRIRFEYCRLTEALLPTDLRGLSFRGGPVRGSAGPGHAAQCRTGWRKPEADQPAPGDPDRAVDGRLRPVSGPAGAVGSGRL